MDALILEVSTRSLHRYFNLDQDSVRVGRALDNDVILSDPTVAPHHLKISRTESGGISIENLAKVNPAKINNRLQDRFETSTPPVSIQLGRVKATILARDQPVASTRPLAGYGQDFALFKHRLWVYLLPIICLLVGGLNYFLGNFSLLRWDALFSYLLQETALSLGLIILALTVIERLLVNRWEIPAIIICVCAFYLVYTLASLFAYQFSYVLSSHWPQTLFKLGWQLFVIPAAISLYLIRFSHIKNSYGIILAIIISSPYTIPLVLNNPIVKNLSTEFSKSAKYHNSLSVLNWHWSKTVPIREFIHQAEKLESGKVVD